MGIVDGDGGSDDNEDLTDEHGQGTYVAGTIAKITAKGFEGEILPIFVNFDPPGRESFQKVAASIRYATDLGAEVITMTLGPSAGEIIDEAIEYADSKGAVVVVAAGDSEAGETGKLSAGRAEAIDAALTRRVAEGQMLFGGAEDERAKISLTDIVLHAGALAWSTLAGLTGDYVTLGGYQSIYQRLEMGLVQLRNR